MEGILNKHFSLARNICALLALALLLLILFPIYIKDDNASATTGTSTSSTTSLTLTTNHTSANVAITPNSANGTFAMSSAAGEAQFNVTTNNYTGYELSIVADDDNGNLVNINNDIAHTISSIPSSITKSSFDTTTYNNKWGYKPNKYVSNNTVIDNTGDSAVFLPSPTTTGTVLDHTTAPNTTANNYTIALGIRADHNTYAGTYTKTFTLVATANPITYTINYNKNTTDSVSNMPTTQFGTASATGITLANNTPERENYNFLGWCTVQTIDSSCSGTTYQPGDTYGIDQTTANTAALYAMWELEKFTINIVTTNGADSISIDSTNYNNGTTASLAYGSTHTITGNYTSGYEFDSWSTSGNISLASTSSATTTMTVTGAGTLTLTGKPSCSTTITGTMQDFKPCSSITNGTTGTLTDSRDGTSYAVGKLADGKWWLLDNLALDLTNSTVQANLTEATTNASNTTLNYLKNGGGTTSDKYATAGVANWTSSYSFSTPLIATSGSDPYGDGDWTKDTLQSYGSGSGKIGIYYNYCAASAGSYCYGDGTSYGSPSGNATEDICPKGWRMPTGGGSGEYQALYTAYSSNATNFKNALRVPLSGNFFYGSAEDQGSRGYFLSSTYEYSYSMYILSVYSSNVSPQSYGHRGEGSSVRCVLDPPVSYTITYSKNTNDTVSNMPVTHAGTANFINPATLSANIPTRSGYAFLGWCDSQTTIVNGADSCSGTTVGPGGKYTVSASSPNVTLYAMWVAFPTLAMQNVTSSTCPTTPTYVYDNRDNEVYAIQKLADGKCWLLDNLRLDLTNATVKNNLTVNTTNASNTTLNYLKNGGGTTSDKYATAGVANWTSSYSYSAPLIVTSGTGNNGSWTKDTLQSYGSGSGKIGVYYNYCAASAGSYCYGNGTSYGSPSGNATEDICPAGWRMPTSGSSGEYKALYTAYSSNATNFKNALRTPLSGYFDNGSAYYQGSDGAFWSSTGLNGSYYVYRLNVDASNVSPQYADNRRYGDSVRCVLDPLAPYTVTYNKNTNDTVSNMPSEQTGSANFVTPITISSNTPTRSGYAFLGWCTTQPTTSNNTDSCSGTTYAPSSQLTPTGSAITLYAMWTAKYTITLALTGNATGITINSTNYTTSVDLTAGTYTISGSYASGYEFSSWATSGSVSVASTSSASTTMTVSGAGTLTLNGKQSCVPISGYLQNFTDATNYCTIGTLTDNRDGTSYTVGKLADGRWWLLDNLALDLTNSTVKANLSVANTNASNTTLNYLKNGGGTTSDKYATAGVANWTSSHSFSTPLIATSGSGNNGSWTKDTLQSYGSGSGKIGVYYNYCAASAGSYCYGDGTSYGSSSGNATEDICPKGWRMPTGGSSGEYQALYTAYSSNATNFKNALRTPLSGRFDNGSAEYQVSYGFFWSSTYYASYGMYYLLVGSSNVYPPNYDNRYEGISVRCVLQ